VEPAAGNAPASSALQKRRDYLSIHAGKENGGSRRACSPSAEADDLFSKPSRRACPVHVPEMVGRHGAAPCSAV
jgi:hypothetical protein